MNRLWRRLLLISGFALSIASFAQASTACEENGGGVRIGDATVLLAQTVSSGSFTAPDGRKFDGLPEFCRIVAWATPSSASNIVIEVWMPVTSAWNGKILGTGNGGFAGAITYGALAGGLKRGYAVANTDMGTYPAALPGVSYEAGDGRPEAVKDWGYRATHEMALLTRQLVERFYGKPANRSYFAGCSTGGHQGLSEAQRYPEDYDAILAGAPGYNRTHLHAMFAALGMAMSAPDADLTPASLMLWANAVKKVCVGKDGGAPTDAFLTDPTQCRLSPRELLCKLGEDKSHCLQEGQARAIEKIYAGTRNPRTGGLIYPPEMRGTEDMFIMMLSMAGSRAHNISTDLSRWVFGPDWNGATFDFDRDMAKEDEALAGIVNATDPDLSRFAARGGRLILFHGWADAVVSPLDSILYYDRITGGAIDKNRFVRLFMAPGMSHCGGGSGPNLFGQMTDLKVGNASNDLLVELDHWVETGEAPETVLATRYENANPFVPPAPDAKPVATRPLCAYPKIARYNGSGDPNKAESFTCSEASPVRYERPATEYLK